MLTSSSLRSSVQWQNLRHVHPRDTVRRRAKDEHVDEEESDTSFRACFTRRFRVLGSLETEAQQNGDHHH